MTFISYLESQGHSHIEKDAHKYLYGIMRNTWANYLRDKYRQPIVSIDEETFESIVDRTVKHYEDMSTQQRAIETINQLPEKQQKVLHMRLIEEIPIKDIAKELGKDRNYVKTTYKRGLKNLKEAALIATPTEEL
jgi:RNA polymerase sigma factor (sigma-70 family)